MQHSPDRVMLWVPCNIFFFLWKKIIKVEIIISHFLFWSQYFYMDTRCHSVFPAVSVTTECIKIIFLIWTVIFTNSRVKAMSKKYISFGHFSLIHGIFSDFLPHVYKHGITNKIIIIAIQKHFCPGISDVLALRVSLNKFPMGWNVLIAPLYSLDICKLNCFAKGQKEHKLVGEVGKIVHSIFPTLHPRLPMELQNSTEWLPVWTCGFD